MSSVAPDHSRAFRRRRALNWAPLGLAYAFLYFGRYNLTVAKNALGDLMSNEQFGTIFGIGAAVYGLAGLINGPLTDRIGGRAAILLATFGATFANAALGWYTKGFVLADPAERGDPVPFFAAAYAVNMYFQNFGAIAIVKVNSSWFHVRERGQFSAIFGSIISFGLFLAFDVGYRIVTYAEGAGPEGLDAIWWVFDVPAIALAVGFAMDYFLVRDKPSDTGHVDFDTGAARVAEDESKPLGNVQLILRILSNPIVVTVCFIEFCTGVIRQGVMHWYPLYAKSSLVLEDGNVMLASWGLVLFVAGITGGAFAGLVSDKLFQSRRGPAAAVLYGGIVLATIAMTFSLGGTKPEIGWVKSIPKAAFDAGFRSGDAVVSLDGEPIIDRTHALADLEKPGTHTLIIERRGEKVTVPLDGGAEAIQRLDLRKNLVTVRRGNVPVLLWRGAWAAEMKLEKGDVVLSVDGKSPSNWEEVVANLRIDGTDTPIKIKRGELELSYKVYWSPDAPKKGEDRARFVKAGPVQVLNPMVLGALAFLISLCVIGSHGLLSGTATMDFGGSRGTATAVGLIDGMVYFGTAVQSFAIGSLTTKSWLWWPWFLLPFAVIGFLLSLKIWNAKPRGSGGH